jgi:hypothetical protein
LLQIERSFRRGARQQIASAASEEASKKYSEMPLAAAVTRFSIFSPACCCRSGMRIANARRRIAKVRFLRICTDNEINVVVKPERVFLRGDRYINLEGML